MFNRLLDLLLIKMFVWCNGKTKTEPEFPSKYEGRVFFGREFGMTEAELTCMSMLQYAHLREAHRDRVYSQIKGCREDGVEMFPVCPV